MNNCDCDEYDRGIDPYVDITDEDEGMPPEWLMYILVGILFTFTLLFVSFYILLLLPRSLFPFS